MSIDYDKLFEQIKTSTNKQNDLSKDVIKTEIGSIVLGRLVANIKNPAESTYHYFWHSFSSRSQSDKKFTFMCPTTFGMKCPFCDRSIRMWKSGDTVLAELSKAIRRRENWMANFYVITNNKNAEDNGKVKILRYGSQINKIIVDATEGENSKSFGSKIWRFDEQGCNFKVRAEANSNKTDAWPTYAMSGFMPAEPIQGMTEEKVTQIFNSILPFTDRLPAYSYEELTKMLNEHFLNNEVVDTIKSNNTNLLDENDHIPGLGPDAPVSVPNNAQAITGPTAQPVATTSAPIINEISNTELDSWLKDIK